MAKLDKKQIAELGKLSITVKTGTSEEATKILIKKLADEGVDDTDGEDLNSLMQMYESFVETEESEEEEETEEEEESHEEEEEYDELAEESEEEEEQPKKNVKKPAAPVKKSTKKVEVEEEEEIEEEEEEKPKKPTKIAVAGKLIAKNTGGKPTPKQPEKKAAKKTVSKSILEQFDSENEDHIEMLQPLVDAFPKLNVEMKLLKKGATLFALMKSSKKAVISFDRVRIVEGEMKGDLFFNILKGREEVEKMIETDKDFKNFNANLLFLSQVTIEEALELFSKEFVKLASDRLSNTDKRLTQAREKFENELKSDNKKAASKAPIGKVVKKVEPVEEEEEIEEEEEEVVEVVKKKAVSKVPVKTVVKKK